MKMRKAFANKEKDISSSCVEDWSVGHYEDLHLTLKGQR